MASDSAQMIGRNRKSTSPQRMMRLSFKKTGDENSMNARQKRLVDFLPLDLQQVGHCRFGPLDGSIDVLPLKD